MVPTHSRTTTVGLVLLTLGICTGCVSSPRSEPVGAAAPESEPKSQSGASQPASPAAESEDGQTESRHEFAQPPPLTPPIKRGTAGSSPPSRKAAANGVGRQRDESSPAAAAAAPSPAGKQSFGSVDAMIAEPRYLLQSALRPTQADPPDLRAALQDLQIAVERLSSGHTCDEGCRAYQSMQRAAGKICQLVSNNDPSQRCTAARSRVNMAEQDLKRHCEDCPE